MEVAPLDDSELVARDTRNATKLAAVSAWLRDSTAWMEAAVYIDDLSKRCAPEGESIDHHRANVAHVCAGYAYELLMKSIAKADDVPIDPTHSVRSTFEQLGKQRQSEIQLVAAAQGVADVGKFLDDVDKRLCDTNRKYSMFKTDMWSAGGLSFHFSGPGSIPEFARIHREIAGVGRAALAACGKTHAAFSRRCIPPEPLRFAPPPGELAFFVAFRSKYTRYSSLTRLVGRAPRPHRENWPTSALT